MIVKSAIKSQRNSQRIVDASMCIRTWLNDGKLLQATILLYCTHWLLAKIFFLIYVLWSIISSSYPTQLMFVAYLGRLYAKDRGASTGTKKILVCAAVSSDLIWCVHCIIMKMYIRPLNHKTNHSCAIFIQAVVGWALSRIYSASRTVWAGILSSPPVALHVLSRYT